MTYDLEYTQENYCALCLSILTESTPEQSFMKLEMAGKYPKTKKKKNWGEGNGKHMDSGRGRKT